MNAKTIIGSFLIVVGIIVLGYSGISFTTPGESFQFLGLKIVTREVHYIPPVIGALSALVGGGILLISPRKV